MRSLRYLNGRTLSPFPAEAEQIFVFPAKTDLPAGDFDYADYYPGRAILLRSRDVAIFCVLNDSCGTLNLLMSNLERITGPLGAAQCRELPSVLGKSDPLTLD
jgi:hypothetical protein